MTPNRYINKIRSIADAKSCLNYVNSAEWDDSKPRSQQLREEREKLFKGVTVTQWQKDFYKPKHEKEQPIRENIDMSFEAIQERNKHSLEFLNTLPTKYNKALIMKNRVNKICEMHHSGIACIDIALRLGLPIYKVREVLRKNIPEYKQIAKRRKKILPSDEIEKIVKMYEDNYSIEKIRKVCKYNTAVVRRTLESHYPNFEQVASERFGLKNSRSVNILTDEDKSEIVKLYRAGETLVVIAQRFNKHRNGMTKILREYMPDYAQIAAMRHGGVNKSNLNKIS